MSEIFIIVKKEFWEWRYSLKKMAMLGVVFLFPIIVYNSEGSMFVDASSVAGVTLILAAAMAVSYLTSESLLSEKKSKTMEVLMSTRLSPFSIIIGKIIPGLIMGLILSLYIFIIFFIMNKMSITEISVILIINLLIFIFTAGLITFIITLLVPDEKTFNMISIFVLIFELGILKGLNLLNFTLYSVLTIPLLALMNFLLTIIAKKLLVSTKLFLKI
jgi:ABC-type Na+ efflux pump permease subunit